MTDNTCFSWLTTCPSSDVNFKSHLKEADFSTLERARDYLIGRPCTKTARTAIEREMRRRVKEDAK
jgi:hypothetical protein